MRKIAMSGQIIKYKRDELLKKTKPELVKIILDYQDISIPVSIFATELSPLSSLVKYLHEDKKMPVAQISQILNRNPQTIYTMLRLNKETVLKFEDAELYIPLNNFAKENNSILETISAYLHDKEQLGFSQISKILHKNVKTVWTCYSRLKIKGGTK